MTTVLFAPVTFNLAETTRMIQVARALPTGLRPVFMGYERDYVRLVIEAGFQNYAPLGAGLERCARPAGDGLRPGRTTKSPFTSRT